MNLIAQLNSEIVQLGQGFDFETAYDFVLEQDCEGDFYPDYEIYLIGDNLETYILEADCWVPVE
jgi:hypothetical protein